MVYGDKKPYITALIVPDPEFVAAWAKTNNTSEDLAVLAGNSDFKAVIGKAVETANKQLSTIEKVRKFTLATQAFTVENGQMTPTLKVRRHAVLREYRDALDALYG